MKCGLIGASGKMGQEIKAVFSENGHECVFTLDLDGLRHDSTPEVLIDFSQPEVFDTVLHWQEKFNSPLVVGTTGITGDQIARLKNIASKNVVVQSFSYSKGLHVMLKCVDIISQHLDGWDVEITETHHRSKKDKPSGTALMLREKLGGNVPISSLRLGNVPGDHTVQFGGPGEVISLNHSVTSRRTYAEGVLIAIKFAVSAAPGFYTFNDVLFSDFK